MRSFVLGQIADTILPQSEKSENEPRERNDTIPPENEKRNRQSGFFFRRGVRIPLLWWNDTKEIRTPESVRIPLLWWN